MTDLVHITEVEVFEPKFDDLTKDSDRLMEHIVVLYDRGRLVKNKGVSLHTQYLVESRKRLIDAYFARGLYAELESFWSAKAMGFARPDPDTLNGWERLIDAGQGPRVIRLWRNHLASIKPDYWFRVRSLAHKDYEKSPHDLRPEAEQRSEHAQFIAEIPVYKAKLIAMMDEARDVFTRVGAAQSQLSRLKLERTEIDTGTRRSPGKPDKRKMDQALFWETIGFPDEGCVLDQIDMLPDRLARFTATSIKAFDRVLHEIDTLVYRSDIWALAYLLDDGCSDDDFEAFRCWLILQGRSKLEDTLAQPDRFDVVQFAGDTGGCSMLLDVASLAYEMRTGTPIKAKRFRRRDLGGPKLEEKDFAGFLPRVAAAVRV